MQLARRLASVDSRISLRCEEAPPQIVQSAIMARWPFVAHNADGFDAPAWGLLVGGEQPAWIDTIHGCRAAGLPAGLDGASRALGGEGKSKEGSRAMKLLTAAKVSRGQAVYPVGTPELWLELLRYNVGDVLELERLYNAVGSPEPELLAVHRKINARGIPVDLDLARTLKALWTELADTARDEVSELTGGALKARDLDSAVKVKNWMARKGFPVQSLARAPLEAMIADPDSFFGDSDDMNAVLVELVLRARQSAVRTAPGKLDRILASAVAGRVRNCFVYHGAHTGRWTARDLQPHNFPRGLAGLDVEAMLEQHARREGPKLHDVAHYAAMARGSASDALASLMRPVIRAPEGRRLVICDYASVEARCVAWLARDDKMLAAFADTSRDIYCEMASTVFGEPVTKASKDRRQLGKIIVLGCGYQMGENKFALTAKLGGTDLAKVGVTASQCVAAFRSEYPSVPVAWKAMNRTFIDTIEAPDGSERTACRCVFRREGEDVCIVLPSGRSLRYRRARMEPVVPSWGGEPKPSPCYTSNHGYRKTLYGGVLMENISQASCRDLLADAMVKLDGNAREIVMHVHDEIVGEVDEGSAADMLRDMLAVMSAPPVWAEGFPLSCEGYVSQHYVKSPLPGYLHGAATLGEIRKLEVLGTDTKRDGSRPEGYNSVVFGALQFDPANVVPDSPSDWPYWSTTEPNADEEQILLSNLSSIADVYSLAERYGIKSEELRRVADAHYRDEDEWTAARRRLFRHLRRVIGIAPTSRVISEGDYASLALPGVHWDEIVSHLLTTSESYADAFPFRDSGNPNETVTESNAADWLWRFYREGEPRGRRDRLESVLRMLLDKRREIKSEVVPF